MYTLETKYDAVNYTANVNVASTWDMGPRTYDFITIHWWGSPVGQTLMSIIAWFCGLLPVTAGTSAHFAISKKVAACLVAIQDAAWHAGGMKNGKHGNVCSIGLELDPAADDETYETAGEVIADIWIEIGKVIPLKPHNYWTGTTCPGVYDLDRLTAIATKWYRLKLAGHVPAVKNTKPGGYEVKYKSLYPAPVVRPLGKNTEWFLKASNGRFNENYACLGAGLYDIDLFLQGKLPVGESIKVQFYLVKNGKRSGYFTQRVTGDKYGVYNTSVRFKRPISGYSLECSVTSTAESKASTLEVYSAEVSVAAA